MRTLALTLLLLARMAYGQATAPATAAPAQVPGQNGFSGKVTETMNAGDYTYILVDTGTNKLWAASPRFAVKVGDKAAIKAGMPMDNYHSKILNRDFEVVYFTDRVIVNGGGVAPGTELPAGHPPLPGAAGADQGQLPAGHPPIGGANAAGTNKAKAKVDLAGIKKAQGGNTIAEIFAQKDKLKGKETSVRGKVVKTNSNIMGKNWIHIQDGTGQRGSDDLLVTTDASAEPPSVGETVLVSGKIILNKDFGANYKYDVMIEDAKLVKE